MMMISVKYKTFRNITRGLNPPEGDSGPVSSTFEALSTEHTNTHQLHMNNTDDRITDEEQTSAG